MAGGANATAAQVLTREPAALLTLPAAADASPEDTPIMLLFRKWQAAWAIEQAAYDADESDDICEALGDARLDLEKQMLALPAVDPRDFICKIAAWTDFGVFSPPDDRRLWVEARALIGGAA